MEKVKDFDSWQSKPGRRVAMFEIVYEDNELLERIEKSCSVADLVMIFVMEFVYGDGICRRFDKENVVFFLAGHLNWPCQHAKTRFYPYFFYTVTNFYHVHPRWISALDKDKNNSLFDILLGTRKLHRTMIYDRMSGSPHVVKYFSNQNNKNIQERGLEEFYWEPEILENLGDEPVFATVHDFTLGGFQTSVSHVIPLEIYNQTNYTLVAETHTHNNFSYITEKTIKPLVAGRLFTVASGQYFLRNLRKLGFHTWDGIIDESYDIEPNLAKRLGMMLDQVDWLTKQDPKQIYQKAKPRIEHNQNLILSRSWLQDFINEIKFLLFQNP